MKLQERMQCNRLFPLRKWATTDTTTRISFNLHGSFWVSILYELAKKRDALEEKLVKFLSLPQTINLHALEA